MERELAGHRHQRDWDDLAVLDPLWAIASRPGSRHGRWDDDEFMAGGRRKVAAIMRTLHGLDAPIDRRRALDFGCGVGRLTLPLAGHFELLDAEELRVETVDTRQHPAMLSATYLARRPAV